MSLAATTKRLSILTLTLSVAWTAGKTSTPVRTAGERAILWSNPSDWATRNLFYGPGGKQHQPHGPFTFEKEDRDGTSPKFTVHDAGGVKWKVKLGLEARPETAASRLIWAAGYYANEDYFVRQMQIDGMPDHLHRGQKLIAPGGVVYDARLKREADGEEKIGAWQWNHDEFTGTREWNGLRVLMALINNWDLKDENNAVYRSRLHANLHGERRRSLLRHRGQKLASRASQGQPRVLRRVPDLSAASRPPPSTFRLRPVPCSSFW